MAVVEQEVVKQETTTPVATAASTGTNRISRTSVTSVRTGDSYDRIIQGIWLVTSVVAVMLGIRFLLKLLGGSSQAGFVTFMYNITQPLVAPFHGIFNTTVQGRSILEPESLVAIVIYALIGWGIVSMIRLMARPRPAQAV
jgi:YGGT family